MCPLPDFLQPLEFFTMPFPREAVEEAMARREEGIPHLLHALEWAEAHPTEANSEERPYMLHLFALFLLAQFRETRAYPLVARLFRHPEYETLTGDVSTESLHRILASVCGGDTTEIEHLIEDANVDEWVRSAAVRALGTLLHTGSRTREEISSYLGKLFHGRLEREPNFVWDSVVELCADFGFQEHLAEIRLLYADEIADPYVDSLEDVEREIALPPGTSKRLFQDQLRLIDDTVAEMADWACFDPEASRKNAEFDAELAALDEESPADFLGLRDPDDPYFDDNIPGTPIIRETPKIGRNDRCPCGSGKKYKKCCGQTGAV